MSAVQFTKLIQFTFRESYNSNKEIISQLKDSLLKCKQENYVLKNKDLINKTENLLNVQQDIGNHLNLSQCKTNENMASKFVNINQYTKMKENYEANIEFLTNLIKLKIIGKNFQLDEKVETIIETLKKFLEQIRYFFLLNKNKEIDVVEASHADLGINMSLDLDSTFNDQHDNSKMEEDIVKQLTFPFDSIVHALQIFLNIFQIEWLYYLRSNLLESLNDFIDELVKFILECDELTQVRLFKFTFSFNLFLFLFKVNKQRIECATQMLICLSSCDYLLDHLLRSVIFGLQNCCSYLCDNHSRIEINNLNILLENTISLLECLDSIANIRNLGNFTKIDSNVKIEMHKFLNTIFIQLTDIYPILAIKMARTIQILNLKTK